MGTRLSIRSSAVRGARVGALAGLLASVAGAGYILDNHHLPGISWAAIATLFVSMLAVTGAAGGAVINAAKTAADRRLGRRTTWAPPFVMSAALALIAFPSAAFGAGYFGSLQAPFMGTTVIFTLVSAIAIALTVGIAWLDQHEDASVTPKAPVRRAVVASLAHAIPVVALGAALASITPDSAVLHAFRSTSVPLLGGAVGAVLAIVYGLYAGLVVGAVRRQSAALALSGQNVEEPLRFRIAETVQPKIEAKPEPKIALAPKAEEPEPEIDPLAEEEDELIARFAELERLEKLRAQRA